MRWVVFDLCLAAVVAAGAMAVSGCGIRPANRADLRDSLLTANLGPQMVTPQRGEFELSWERDSTPASYAAGWASSKSEAGEAPPVKESGQLSGDFLDARREGELEPRLYPKDGPPNLQDAPEAGAFAPTHAAQYVSSVYGVNGVDLGAANKDGGELTVVDLYRHAHKKGQLYQSPKPSVGDLAFFHNTHDRNGDGRDNDWYTLVGVVEGVDAGTVRVLAYVDGEVQRIFVNHSNAERLQSGGQRINTLLKARVDGQAPPARAGAAGQLFAGYGNLLGETKSFTVIDNWRP